MCVCARLFPSPRRNERRNLTREKRETCEDFSILRPCSRGHSAKMLNPLRAIFPNGSGRSSPAVTSSVPSAQTIGSHVVPLLALPFAEMIVCSPVGFTTGNIYLGLPKTR